ncbi:MAG TPA: hypothetical protein PKA12_01050 [Saprospiraceae bacterium]|nr:hypothetical protein [Saprospiraceae bacterium]
MNMNILKEKTQLLQEEFARWVGLSEIDQSGPTVLYTQFLQSGCDIYVEYNMACRSGNKKEFTDGLRQVVSAACRLDYWAKCLERWKPEKAGDLYPIKKEAEEIRALCMASIQTIEKKKNPAAEQ